MSDKIFSANADPNSVMENLKKLTMETVSDHQEIDYTSGDVYGFEIIKDTPFAKGRIYLARDELHNGDILHLRNGSSMVFDVDYNESLETYEFLMVKPNPDIGIGHASVYPYSSNEGYHI